MACRFAVTGSEDCTVRVWDLQSGSTHFSPRHQGSVHTLLSTSDGRLAASLGKVLPALELLKDTCHGKLLVISFAGGKPVVAACGAKAGQFRVFLCVCAGYRLWHSSAGLIFAQLSLLHEPGQKIAQRQSHI